MAAPLRAVWVGVLRIVVKSMLQLTPRRLRIEFLYELARRHRVAAFVVEGRSGRIEGRVSDTGLFRHYVREGEWFPQFQEFAARFFARSGGQGTFVDIGANIGLTCIPVARAVAATVVAVEASKDNADLLRRNLQRAGLADRVSVVQAAVMDRPGCVELELSTENLGDHRVRNPLIGLGGARAHPEAYGEGTRELVEVQGRPLDQIQELESPKRPVLVKADIQGAEPLMLAGGRRFFKSVDAMIVEFWPYGIRRQELDPAAFLRDVGEHFDHGAILGTGGQSALIPVDQLADRLSSFTHQEGTAHKDLLLVKHGETREWAEKTLLDISW